VGELDGAVCSNSVLDAIARQGSDEDRRVVWRCAPFNHCNFTVLDDTAGAGREAMKIAEWSGDARADAVGSDTAERAPSLHAFCDNFPPPPRPD